jgi:hypothetical protein
LGLVRGHVANRRAALRNRPSTAGKRPRT